MTTFEYALFISYRNSRQKENGLLSTFARELADALERTLDTVLFYDIGRTRNDRMVFLDENVITGGDWIREEISEGLSRSVCWVLVFTRNYLRGSLFCASELKGMIELQRNRRQIVGNSIEKNLIIPVLFRGDLNDMPQSLRGIAVKTDFRRFTLAVKNLAEQPEFVEHIENLAELIAQRQKEQCEKSMIHQIDFCHDFENFLIDDVNTEEGKQKVAEFINELKSPSFPII